MYRSLAALALALAPVVARAADEENPYKNAKVGDYAVYTVKSKFGDATMTQTVAAKTDKEATVKVSVAANFNGKEIKLPDQELKIDLTKPYDPTQGSGGLPGAEIKAEKDKDGKEKVKVGGKEYDATWTSYKTKIKAQNMEFTGTTKVWLSKDVPLGVVKLESVMEVAGQKVESTMELKETGNKK
jgi:hypothetical protein